jgi:hypothetical protein
LDNNIELGGCVSGMEVWSAMTDVDEACGSIVGLIGQLGEVGLQLGAKE